MIKDPSSPVTLFESAVESARQSRLPAAGIPRPEYPRPQFVRERWMNLNGEWEFTFDWADEGLQGNWYDNVKLPDRIQVPFAYQTPLSGCCDKGVHEVIWYARNFEIPPEWRGSDIILHFGAVDYSSTLWVNGREVGHNRGGHVPFAFDIAPYLHEGSNRICLRVEDRQNPHQPRGKQSSSGQPQTIDYYCTSGIWQTVWLEPAPQMRIDSLRITPLVEVGAFELISFLHAPATGWRVEAEVLDGDTVVARSVADSQRATVRLFLKLADPKLWTPERPHLYTFRVRLLEDGRLLDAVESYAGLRSVTIRNAMLELNGEPRYLVMALDQGYWPDGGLTAPSDAALRADVEWVKRFGFNGVRKHQKIEDPRWLYWCDRLGLLVWGEMANARAWSPEAEEWLLAEWERAVRRDYNSPSVIVWNPMNESMGFPRLREGHAGQYAFLERVVSATRRLDTTRPVIDNDGWEHTDITDIVAIHDYSHDGDSLRKRYVEAVAGGRLPQNIWSGNRAIFARGSRHHGQPVMLTEVGGLLSVPPNASRLDVLYQHYGTITHNDELVEKYEDIVQGIKDLSFVSGFCYTQLTDIEQEMNGLLTYDRQPKVDPERIARIHDRLFGSDTGDPPNTPPD